MVHRRRGRVLLVADLVDDLVAVAVAVAVAAEGVERQAEGHRLSLRRHRRPCSSRRMRTWNPHVQARYGYKCDVLWMKNLFYG